MHRDDFRVFGEGVFVQRFSEGIFVDSPFTKIRFTEILSVGLGQECCEDPVHSWARLCTETSTEILFANKFYTAHRYSKESLSHENKDLVKLQPEQMPCCLAINCYSGILSVSSSLPNPKTAARGSTVE